MKSSLTFKTISLAAVFWQFRRFLKMQLHRLDHVQLQRLISSGFFVRLFILMNLIGFWLSSPQWGLRFMLVMKTTFSGHVPELVCFCGYVMLLDLERNRLNRRKPEKNGCSTKKLQCYPFCSSLSEVKLLLKILLWGCAVLQSHPD